MASAYDLAGRTVFLTGAAQGIGAECARRLADRGARLALVDLGGDQLERVAAEIGEDRAAAFAADVTDSDQLAVAATATVERFGGIDIVIANAGIGGRGGPVRHQDPDAFERVIEVNLLGVYRTVHACLPHVIERRGYVLVHASLAAVIHGPASASYCASKAGAEAFADSLRTEVRHLGVDVGVGYFSWVETQMVTDAERLPSAGRLRTTLPGPAAKTHPVSAVGDAVLAGVEGRRRTVCVPGWIRVLLALRGLLWLVADRGALKAAPELDAEYAADATRQTAGSA